MKASDFDLHLEELSRRSLDRLLCAEVFDLAAFQALHTYLCEKATAIRAEHVVSKQVLLTLLQVSDVLRSRADHNEAVRQNLNLATDFALLLGLIASGEDCCDRRSGNPRIV